MTQTPDENCMLCRGFAAIPRRSINESFFEIAVNLYFGIFLASEAKIP
jgi:hypothetical protein